MPDCSACDSKISDKYRYILWFALVLNFLMFWLEICVSWFAGSVAVFAEAMDFLGDAGNYGASLIALKFSPRRRSQVALAKGIMMGSYGITVMLLASLGIFLLEMPNGKLMVLVSLLALIVNIGVAALLFHYRNGDSNRRSVWLCSRNDAIINICVLLAGLIVSFTHQRWPDIMVAFIIGALGMKSSFSVIQHAYQELTTEDHLSPRI